MAALCLPGIVRIQIGLLTFGVVRRVVDLLQYVGHVRRLALLVLELARLRLVLLGKPVVRRNTLIVDVVHKVPCRVRLVLVLYGLLRVRFLRLVLVAALAQELGRHRLRAAHLLLFRLCGAVLGVVLVLSSAFNAQLVYYAVVEYARRLHLLFLLDLRGSVVHVQELLLVGLLNLVVVVIRDLVVVERSGLVPA